MRLILIHPHLHVVGGSERLTQILLYELDRRGSEVLVLTGARNPEYFPETKNIKFRLFKRMDIEVSELRVKQLLDLVFTLDDAFREFETNIVFSMIQEPIYLVLSKVIKPNVGTAVFIHFPFEEELTKENIEQFLRMYRFPGFYEDMYRFVDIKMTNSNYTARALYRYFGLESNVVYPAIPWSFFKLEPDLEYDPGPSLISVGRFVPQKRLDLLIEIFRDHVKPKVPEAKLFIVGVVDPRYKDYHEKLLSLAESTRDVEVIDRPLMPKELVEIYREARAYVHLRIGEHFGMAPVEAMSQGAIPILPMKSGLAELLTHGWNGYMYQQDSEIADYILRVLRMSRKDYLSMKKMVYRKALYFNPDRFASDVVGYLSLLETKQRTLHA
ncbi:MAG: hypothetical protein DRN15_07505 [Thermoprotei archaeon]|nr:MAG: hypothetical protein DRN15_07505 [Thermoprotei archaeon]RLF25027.1 MAG: hypothetical protein DRM97_02535 [Thermoprotei archaeon]